MVIFIQTLEMTMTQTFECPSCGAPLDYKPGDSSTIHCPFCNTSVIVPNSLHASDAPQAQPVLPVKSTDQASDQARILNEITLLARSDKKIQAIKLYRMIYRVGLVEAKDAVEALERGESIQPPNPVLTPSNLDELNQSVQAQSQAASQPARKPRTCLAVTLAIAAVILIAGVAFAIFLGGLITSSSRSPGSSGATSNPDLGGVVSTLESQAGSLGQAVADYGAASLLLSFGEKGIGPGQFEDARSIAIGPDGAVFLAEYQGGRVLAFDAGGKFVRQWNTGDRKSPLLGLMVSSDGVVSVLQKGSQLQFTSQGEALKSIDNAGAADFPEYLASTPDGGYVVVASGEDIYLFDAQGQNTLTIKSAVSHITDDSELDSRVAVDGEGNIYILGQFNNAVLKYSPEGKYLNRFGSDGDDPGQFRAPEDIAVDGQGRVFVSDFKGVQIFSGDGRYLGLIKVDGAAFGLAVDRQDNLYVITNQPKVYKLKVTLPTK